MNKITGRLMIEFASFLGRCELKKVDFYSSHAVKKQKKILKKIMKQNKNTV